MCVWERVDPQSRARPAVLQCKSFICVSGRPRRPPAPTPSTRASRASLTTRSCGRGRWRPSQITPKPLMEPRSRLGGASPPLPCPYPWVPGWVKHPLPLPLVLWRLPTTTIFPELLSLFPSLVVGPTLASGSFSGGWPLCLLFLPVVVETAVGSLSENVRFAGGVSRELRKRLERSAPNYLKIQFLFWQPPCVFI